ncbi:GntR family transcriptional regulator, partial [Arthrobacter deserti]|nr:GntR family transcriptional regulator [Arthrobacter deserti]
MARGSVFSQSLLAQELGVSTTPLREALRRLAAEGMVQLESHRDARVTPLTAEEARDLYVIRESLDPLAAALAAASRTPGDISSI